MSKNTLLYFLLLILLQSCNAQQKTDTEKNAHDKENHLYTNELVNESSPYLLQHAHNPVNWYPWGDKALEKAKAENKMLLISVGYAACHWCHVMEHESFEDTSVARIMNENFVCIKVDREERPDVDQIYMNAAYLTNGRGGWPLNALALPDGRPFFAGTYFQKQRWMQVLNFFMDKYKNELASVEEEATRITNGIQTMEKVPFNSKEAEFKVADLDGFFSGWDKLIDYRLGGRKTNANKFPMPSNYLYLLRYYHLTKNEKALEATKTTLDQMAMGGIYDQLGGGFARYSTDPEWLVPHFEKMLYDNGQLVSLYSEAYQLERNPLYKKVVYETLDFIKREMTSPEGGFYSSLDADSDGEEGKFYVWQKSEIDTVLGAASNLFCKYYNVTDKGNWEHGKNIFHKTKIDEQFARGQRLTLQELERRIKSGKEKLFPVRAKRIRPGLDDKVLTAWNALMLKGYIDAYRVFGEPEFLDIALKNANFIVSKCLQDGNRLTRNYKDGKAVINGFLDDYSLTIEAFIALYQATFDEQWLYKAKDLADYAIAHFKDEESKMFFYTSDLDDPLIARKMKVSDNVIPSPNSSMAKALYLLGLYFYDENYISQSKQLLNNVKDKISGQAPFYSNWAIMYYYAVNEPYEVAILGEDADAKRQELDKKYLPNTILLGGKKEGTLQLLKNKLVDDKTTIYVCRQKVCKLPVTEVAKALPLIK